MKRSRGDGARYDGVESSRKVASLFCSYNKDLGSLPESIAEYWLATYILPSSQVQEEPSREHREWLADALEFLAGERGEFRSITMEDWAALRDLVGYEAEDLPLEVLQPLMGTLLERGVLR